MGGLLTVTPLWVETFTGCGCDRSNGFYRSYANEAATVCRVRQRLRTLLAIKPATRPADATERLWIVDRTLIPVRDRKVGASSRTYRCSANVQVIIDADT